MNPERIISIRYDLFAARDFDGLRQQMTPEVVWHVPGRNPHAGKHVGRDAVVDVLRGIVDLSEGTSKVEPRAVLAGDAYVAAVEAGSAQRYGRDIELLNVTLFRIEREKIAEMWFLPGDQHAIDAFWAADAE